jgi:hypothetical protein
VRLLRIAFLLIATLCLGAIAPVVSQQPRADQSATQAIKRTEEMVPMRDGVRLATSIFLPEGQGPWPTVLVRTPYGKDSMGGGAAAWTRRGYGLVIQDCRGRFKSEGRYRPFADDGLDGYDTVEWVAKQPWSNGKVGMHGGSAMGITANLAAIEAPPHLVACFVLVARSSVYHQSSFIGGVFRKEMNEQWLKRQGSLDTLNETFKHNVYDHFYDSNEMSLHWGKVRVPIYNWGGWYDIFSEGNIQNFAGVQSKGGNGARGNQKLMMGPWAHGQLEEVKYPANSVVNANEEAARWFDYWLKGIDNGIMKEPPVKYYVMGDVTDPLAPGNEWQTAKGWPVPARTTSYYLASGGKLSETVVDQKESTTGYSFDPRNPVPTIGGGNLFIKKGPMDQRAAGDRKDIPKFATEPLTSPVGITGKVIVELWAESDAPDTDWMVKLVDIYPDGAERLVLDSALRARFREGFDREVFMKKGQAYKFTIDLWCTSLIFNKGHRIGIHVTSSNDPRFDPNPNTGKPLRSDSETRIANNTVHHDRAHPSRALLPVVPVSDGKRP